MSFKNALKLCPSDFLSVYQQDFRDAVSKASRQSGKPVIEDRFLNQILYSLPQLYELNQNLLSELRQRIAKWYNKVFYLFIFFTESFTCALVADWELNHAVITDSLQRKRDVFMF